MLAGISLNHEIPSHKLQASKCDDDCPIASRNPGVPRASPSALGARCSRCRCLERWTLILNASKRCALCAPSAPSAPTTRYHSCSGAQALSVKASVQGPQVDALQIGIQAPELRGTCDEVPPFACRAATDHRTRAVLLHLVLSASEHLELHGNLAGEL